MSTPIVVPYWVEVGQIVRGRYEITKRLGSGAHGTVFEVSDLLFDRRVALKALWPDPTNRSALESALRAEFGVLASLCHPLLCRVFDFGRLPPGTLGDDRAGLFLTRQLVDGVDLHAAAIQANRDVMAVCTLVAQAARGLSALHHAGLRHGDFKPANAIVDSHGAVRLIDFGLAVGEATMRAAGTLAYMAPEVLSRRTVDRRADLYALGVSLFQLCSGQLPSGDRTGAALVSWHLEGVRPALSDLIDAVPAELERLVTQLLSVSADERVPTASEVALTLEFIADKLGAKSVSTTVMTVPVVSLAQVGSVERAFSQRLAGDGASALVELVGEEGGGKTSVLTEVSWRLQLAGAEVVRADSRGHGKALGAVGSALSQLATLADEPIPLGSERNAEELQAQHFAAIARWLGNVAMRFPVVLLVDDIDVADLVSQQLVYYLSSALPDDAAVFIIATRRPLPSEVARQVARAGTVPQVWLTPFSADDVGRLLRRAAGRAAPALAARIHRVTGGNLLHTNHVLRYLAERGFPLAHSLDALTLPTRLQQSATALLDQTAESDALLHLIYQALAVLSRAVTVDVLHAIVTGSGREVAADAIAGALKRGSKRGALVGVDEQQVCFARPALGQGVYQLLTHEQRAALHGVVAAVLVAQVDQETADPEVVFHAIRAGDSSCARDHTLATVRRLWRGGDHVAALTLGVEAMQVLAAAHMTAPAELQLALGELARLTGDLDQAKHLLEPLTQAAQQATNERARYILGCAYEEGGQPDAAIPLFDAVLAGDTASQYAPLVARALSRLYIKRGRNDEALAVVDAALRRDVKPELVAHLDVARLFIMASLGTDNTAETALADHARAAIDAGDDGLAATAFNYAALLAFRRGDYPCAQQLYSDALAPARRDGDAVRVGTMRMNIASVAFHLGDYAACYQQHTAALSLLVSIGAETPAAISRRNLGHLLVELGEYEQARAELSTAARAASALQLDLHSAGCEALLGIVDCRAGDWKLGVARLETATSCFADLDSTPRVAETLLDIAEVCLEAVGTEAEAAASYALERAEALTATTAKLGRRARYFAYRAELAARDDEEVALVHLERLAAPLQELTQQHKHHSLWNLHRAAARAYETLGDIAKARQHRDQAMTSAETMAQGLSTSQLAVFWHDPRRRWLRNAFADTSDANAVADTHISVSDDRVTRLLDIYRRMSSERDYRRLLDMVMQAAVELSGAERGFLLLAEQSDDGEAVLRTAVSHNLSIAAVRALAQADTDPLAASVSDSSYSRTIAERVFETGERVVSDNPRLDPRFDQAQSVHALHLQSVVCLPVHSRGVVAGVLYLEARYRRVEFSAADVRLLTAFGDQVAILLDNARLLDENTARADELGRAHHQIEQLLAERTAMLDERTEQLALTRRELATMRRRFLGDRGAFGLIGRSVAMERVFELIERLAAADVPVLIVGESGTGKELVARALHDYGVRHASDMVSVNCAALPQTLLESELFGHVRGAFTGADRDRRGLFEVASGGTLFLDEIGDTPPRMQAGLLRALQEGVIRRVGSTEDIAVDVRIVAATNRDLEALVADGSFREDLYYRLNVVSLKLPALRERDGDVAILADHFLKAISGRTGIALKSLSRAALSALSKFAWPGNVRQLEHALTNAAVLSDNEQLMPEDFDILAVSTASVDRALSLGPDERRDRERSQIVEALEACGWNKSKAARLLHMPRRTFYRRLTDYGIQ